MKSRKIFGFTVIELLASVAILAALVALAIPAYRAYVIKARTTEATNFLSAAQVAEKSFFQAEQSYTLCLPAILSAQPAQIRYYALGFNFPGPNVNACGRGGTQDCHQKCFTSSKCANTAKCTHDSGADGIAFSSNAFQVGQNVDFYNPIGVLGAYSSSISTNDFEVVAATDETLFASGGILDELYPNAYAAAWKVMAIGPSGGVYEKKNSGLVTCYINCSCAGVPGTEFGIAPVQSEALLNARDKCSARSCLDEEKIDCF